MARIRLRRRAMLATGGLAAAGTAGCLGILNRKIGGTPEDVDTTALFVSGNGKYPVYRIPALLVTRKGTLLAFCEARRSKAGDRVPTDIVLRRSTDGGRTWSDRKVVYSEDDATLSNPTPVQDRSSGKIHLPITRNYREQLIITSTDDGRSWAEPQEITHSVKRDDWGYYATGPGTGIQLRREPYQGRLVIPATHWTYLWEGNIPDDNVRSDHIIYSDDTGQTWELGGIVSPGVDEPQVIERSSGRLLMNMRNHRDLNKGPTSPNARAIATSKDGGDSWSDVMFDETLVTPTCQASFIRYSWPTDGRSRVLFANPAHPNDRVDLTVRLSYDEGKSWAHSKLLYDSKAAYSSLAKLPDGSVGCLYEQGDVLGGQYERIAFSQFTIGWLTEGADTLPATSTKDFG